MFKNEFVHSHYGVSLGAVVISPNTVTTMLTPLSPDVHSVVEHSFNTNSSACLYVTGQH